MEPRIALIRAPLNVSLLFSFHSMSAIQALVSDTLGDKSGKVFHRRPLSAQQICNKLTLTSPCIEFNIQFSLVQFRCNLDTREVN